MSGSIYKFFRARPTEAFYQLNAAERQALLDKNEQIGKEMGLKQNAPYECTWGNERWAFFGIQEYPDLETLLKYEAALEAMDWFRYVEAETMLGTAFGGTPPGA
jgi:hypothetical protein